MIREQITRLKLELMIISQCAKQYPFNGDAASTLSDRCKELKEAIKAEAYFDQHLIEVWINEDASQNVAQVWWSACVEKAKSNDLMLMLNSRKSGKRIGMCHAKFEAALAVSAKKIYVLTLTDKKNIRTSSKRDGEAVLGDSQNRQVLQDLP